MTWSSSRNLGPADPPSSFRRVVPGLLLSAIVALGVLLRLGGTNWDSNQHLHPDERFLTMVLAAERWPSNVAEYFDEARSPLNPRNVGFESFAYGTLPTTLVKGVSRLLGVDDYDGLAILGRRLSALADLGSLLFLFLAARRLYRDARVALLAAALFAVCVLPIQHAHFFVVDTFATFFVTAAVWALASSTAGQLRWYALCGALFGLAVASKLSVASFAAVIAAAAWPGRASDADRSAPIAGRLTTWAMRGAIAAAAAFAAFRLAQPDAFTGPGLFGIVPSHRWLHDVAEARRFVSGDVDFPPGVQWAGRMPYWFAWKNLVLWGMGPMLGLAAWSGWAVAAWRLVRRSDPRHLIPVAWIGVLFLHLGGQFVMTGRYYLPIYPMLVLLAAWGIVTLVKRPATRRLGLLLGTATVLFTVLWAGAFTSIYRRPHTRVAASEWIHDRIPAGSTLAGEYWDDRLPLPLPGLDAQRYEAIELRNYDDDTPAKLTTLVESLDRSDFVILSSNRLSESIPRLPMRYPMTSRYYELLLSGQLGFERVADFTSYPSLGPFQVPDQSAEEAFSVYDHPRVQIFGKTPAWSRARAAEMLGRVSWDAVVKLNPRDARRLGTGLMLTPEARVLVRDAGTWSGIFDPGSFSNRWPVPVWLLTIEVLGVVVFPLLATFFSAMPDRGWLLAKGAGLLLVAYLSWLTASLGWLPFTRGTMAFAILAVALASTVVAWRRRDIFADLWRSRRRLLIGEQCLFWACFAAFLFVRMGNPDLWHPFFGGEKPMDFAYLNAVLRSEHFPAYDPWFAGGYLNYYYFGFVLVATLTKLTGIVPQVAYNLAVPTFAALTAAGAFAIVHALARRAGDSTPGRWPLVSAIAAVVFTVGIGNLTELRLMARAVVEGGLHAVPNWFWYWNASRAIPHPPTEAPPITEFPFFTFLYGDLHAHMMALPFTLLVLALLANAILGANRHDRARGRAHEGVLLGTLGLATGTLYATNTWDYPTYVAITVLVLMGRHRLASGTTGAISETVWQAGWRTLVVVAVGQLLFWPFVRDFAAMPGGVDLWTGSRTSLPAYVTIHGVFLFVLTSLAVCGVAVRLMRATPLEVRDPRSLFLAAIVGVGFALTVMVEIVVVDGDVSRMNTVFKFYYQVWILFALAAALSLAPLARAWAHLRDVFGSRVRLAVPAVWIAALMLLVTGAAAYVPLATRARWLDRFDPGVGFTLDGQAYMQSAVHEEQGQEFGLGADLAAIRWLEREIAGTPVIVEARTPQYRWGGRISANTGLPTILGWSWHQRQQRAALPGDPVGRREEDVRAIYEDPDSDQVLAILRRYRAEYVYVGDLERALYSRSGLAKFESNEVWQRVYDRFGVRIYRVRSREGTP